MQVNNKRITFVQTLLALSLLANGFAFGYISAMPKHEGHPPPPFNPEERLFAAADHLSPSSQDKVRDILYRQTATRDHKMSNGAAIFKEIRALLMAPETTPQDVQDALDKMSAHHHEMSQSLGLAIVEIFAALPDAQERSQFFREGLPPRPPFDGPRRHHNFKKGAHKNLQMPEHDKQ